MGDLLESLVREAKSGQYCVVGSGSLHGHLANLMIQQKYAKKKIATSA
jgi:hypothetical protein